MKKRMTVNEFIKKFDNGDFESANVGIQCDAGWFDWFCKDSSLVNKTRALGKKVKQIAESSKVDKDRMYVFFKNNCPMSGSLYDDFCFCDVETRDVVYAITPSNGHTSKKGQSDVWGKENNFAEPLAKGNWKDIKNFFGIK